jgi:hypothetical protein
MSMVMDKLRLFARFDHYRLTERCPHAFSAYTTYCIRGSAHWERYDDVMGRVG